MQLNGMSRFSVENFPSQGAERFRCGTLWYIRKVRLSKNFMSKRLITLFSVEFFYTYTASKVRWRTPLCFRIFGISKIFMLSRGQRNFPSAFWPPSTENLVGNPFSLTQYFGYRNFLCMRAENQVFQTNFNVSEYAKKFGKHFLVSE